MGKITATNEELLKLYETRTLRAIAAMFQCNDEAVRKRLHKAGAQMRPRGGAKQFDPPRQELETLYQSKSMREIADLFGVGETVVWKRLKEHGIVLRDFENGGHRLKPGRTFSRSHRKSLSKAHKGKWSGEKNPNWKGGAHHVNLKLRASGEYKTWKQEAMELRGFKCQQCGVKQHDVCPCCGTHIRLHVHHVESFAKVPDKRFDPHNSEVLCPGCHHSRHHGKSGELRETPNV